LKYNIRVDIEIKITVSCISTLILINKWQKAIKKPRNNRPKNEVSGIEKSNSWLLPSNSEKNLLNMIPNEYEKIRSKRK
jgi:hypothetical protein